MVARALGPLVGQEGVAYEILVVDNGVTNSDTEKVVKEFSSRFPALRYLRFEKQLGYAGAVNEGARAARAPLVAVTNNDNLPAPGWLKQLVLAYEREAKAGRDVIVSSLVHRPDFPEPLASHMNFCGRIVRVPGAEARPHIPFHPDGSSFLFRRESFAPPYDDDYFIYHEDVAIGWRAWLTGRAVVMADQSKAETFDGGSTRRIAYRTAFYTERNRWLNFLLFPSFFTLLRWLPLLWIDAVVRLVAGSNRRAKVHAWCALLASPVWVSKKRRALQAVRARTDADILPLISGSYLGQHERGASLVNPFFRGLAKLLCLPFGP
jgi:GT2 family glycosyltransferase